jgi:hypothetical protein
MPLNWRITKRFGHLAAALDGASGVLRLIDERSAPENPSIFLVTGESNKRLAC